MMLKVREFIVRIYGADAFFFFFSFESSVAILDTGWDTYIWENVGIFIKSM